ncbi:MAG: hypothetical protein HFE63_01285 [Clostridiales bacterium]|nr:hypothetical protein [Clostridiales bacterium]
MKLIEYANAYAALRVLSALEFPYSSAYAIAELKRMIAPKAEFFSREELRLAESFGVKLPDGRLKVSDGKFDFRGETDDERRENCRLYNERRDELAAVEDSEAIEPVSIIIPASLKLTPLLIEALDRFVIFEVENAD